MSTTKVAASTPQLERVYSANGIIVWHCWNAEESFYTTTKADGIDKQRVQKLLNKKFGTEVYMNYTASAFKDEIVNF